MTSSVTGGTYLPPAADGGGIHPQTRNAGNCKDDYEAVGHTTHSRPAITATGLQNLASGSCKSRVSLKLNIHRLGNLQCSWAWQRLPLD